MSLDQAQFYANARAIYAWWIGQGRTHAFACGMLANAEAESSLDPNAIGDHGGAFGLHQLHMDRVRLIRDGDLRWPGCKIDISKLPSIAQQLEAVSWELRHSENDALRIIEAEMTPYSAGSACCRYYERPGALGQAAKRGHLAQEWDAYFTPKVA